MICYFCFHCKLNMSETLDRLLIYFDQEVRFPMRVRLLRFKNKFREFQQQHPFFIEWAQIVLIAAAFMFIEYWL